MNRRPYPFICSAFSVIVLAGLTAAFVRAASPFVSSADGLSVYDSTNNITWLADANLAGSTRFGLPGCNGTGMAQQICINASGSMNYASAVAWVAAMNDANYLGHHDWQLPTTPLNDTNCGRVAAGGGGRFGFGCTEGALPSMYNALGFKSPNTAVPVPNNSVGPFQNVQPYLYWSQTNAGVNQGNSTFSFATGWLGANTLPNFLYLWPMIPGRLPGLPVPNGTGLQVSPDGQTVYDPAADVTWVVNANLAATNTFGLPVCTSPTAPAFCAAQDGAMTFDSATQFLANMNSAGYLGQKKWQAPTIDGGCGNFNCSGTRNPMGNLYYVQFGIVPGVSAVPTLSSATGPFRNLQPYLYWTCAGATISSPCDAAGPVVNQEWSYSFGSGFQGTDILQNNLYVTAYFVGNRTSSASPTIAVIQNAAGENSVIAPNTWIEIKGANLAPAGSSRIWQASDFSGNQMPVQLDRVSATVNGKAAYVYYISPNQINVLTPPDAISGPVSVVVTNNGVASAPFTAQAQSVAPGLFAFAGGPYVAAIHVSGALIGPATLYPGATTPAKPGETIAIYTDGFGPTNIPLVSGSVTQSGTLSPLPAVQIGNSPATVQFAGLVAPGEFQFNVVVPPSLAGGDQPITVTYNGTSTQAGMLLTVQR